MELRNTVNMLETHDLGHSIYRSVVRLLQTFLQVSLGVLGWGFPTVVFVFTYVYMSILTSSTPYNNNPHPQAMVMGLGALAVMQQKMTGEQLTSFLFYVNFVSAASFDVGDRWTSIQVR